MGGRGVGISTDMGVVSSGPRFNPATTLAGSPQNCNASSAYAGPIDAALLADQTRTTILVLTIELAHRLASRPVEESGAPWAYNHYGQTGRVVYHDPAATFPEGSILRHLTPDGRHQTPDGAHEYDINIEGTKTYGSLPDLLQDAVNAGVDKQDMLPLLHSAQDYVDMWQKAYVVTGCYASNHPQFRRCAGNGSPIDPGIGVCANTCPDSPGRGHLLLPNGSPICPVPRPHPESC
jgi:hypothetical protein